MGSNLYWVSTLTYAGILAFLLCNDIKLKKNPEKTEKSFRVMMVAMTLFCLQDTLWGLCDCGILASDRLFFFSTTIFHAGTVIATFFWLVYVLDYAGVQRKNKERILLLDGVIIIFELVLVAVNCVTPVLFYIQNGVYMVGRYRVMTFLNQFVVYLGIGVVARIFSMRRKSMNRTNADRVHYVFMASLAPVLTGILQFLYPEAPFYSMGYFLGCIVIYNLVVTRDREDDTKTNFFKSLAQSLNSMHIFDLEYNMIERIVEPEFLSDMIKNERDLQTMLNKVVDLDCTEDFFEEMKEFVDISTLPLRFSKDKVLEKDFISKGCGWMRMSFVCLEYADGELKKFAVTTQDIDSEKRKQIELLFISNNDVLTGLRNRRSFEHELEKIQRNQATENLVLLALDVNELKKINDSLGHKAGDELIQGAANCIKRCFSSYGKLYRVGGDEFVAILYCTAQELQAALSHFEKVTEQWHGELVDQLNVAFGYAAQEDMPQLSINDLLTKADHAMYEAKANYYMNKGVDRRAQKVTD